MRAQDQFVIVGWRRLAFRRWGVRGGEPVVLVHGTPGSRLSQRPSEAELAEVGVELITYDRPGYGLSDPHPGRRVADAAADVRAIADHLGIERFAVLGRSGGGPHALACAALLPDRVTRVASLAGPAPYGGHGLDWMRGMTALNQEHYTAALRGVRPLTELVYPHVVAMRADPEHMARRLEVDAPVGDVEWLQDPALREVFVDNMREAVGRTVDGWVCDSMAFTRPWGFDPRWIRVPALLWHAVQDAFVPVTHSRWLAARIRSAVLMLSETEGHFSASAVQHGAVRWLVRGGAPELAAG